MHFWINKPAGRYYGFTGRRYPATPLPKIRSNHRWRGDEVRQSALTPIHPFQGFGNATEITAGPSNVNSYRTIVRHPRARNENNRHGSSSLSAGQLTQLNNIPNNVTDASNNQLILSNATAGGANRNLLGFSEFNDADLAGFRLRCGVWITFVLATGFVAAAKFYFGYRGPGLEILVFCGLLLLLLTACLYSIFCRVQSHGRPENRMQEEHIAVLTNTANVSVGESVRPPVSTTVRHNPPPPPPYHIAILIPPSNPSMDEAPPPSYDKIMR